MSFVSPHLHIHIHTTKPARIQEPSPGLPWSVYYGSHERLTPILWKQKLRFPRLYNLPELTQLVRGDGWPRPETGALKLQTLLNRGSASSLFPHLLSPPPKTWKPLQEGMEAVAPLVTLSAVFANTLFPACICCH